MRAERERQRERQRQRRTERQAGRQTERKVKLTRARERIRPHRMAPEWALQAFSFVWLAWDDEIDETISTADIQTGPWVDHLSKCPWLIFEVPYSWKRPTAHRFDLISQVSVACQRFIVLFITYHYSLMVGSFMKGIDRLVSARLSLTFLGFNATAIH